MKKRRRIFAFWISIIMLVQLSLGVRAAEMDNSADGIAWKQGEDTSDGAQELEENADNEDEWEIKEITEEEIEDAGSEMDPELQEYLKEAQDVLDGIARKDSLMALIYLCDYYSVKKEPGIDSGEVVRVPSGTTVLINGMGLDEDYNIWYRVSLEHNGSAYTGYVDRSYLAYSNEIFIDWENTYFPQMTMFALDIGGYPDIEQFPASYQDKLMRLKQAHPNWIFVRQNTGLDWQKVVSNEDYKDRSLISGTMGAAYRDEYHSPGWYYASEAAVQYYLDPRNFLDETRIFQFEQLTYNASYHSKAAVQNILNNTFMKGELPGAGMTYADAFFQVGVSLKVSPFHLACRVYQEQGEGKSALISGNYDTVPEYKGYYNYYNIGASGTTVKQVVESGLARAVKEGWNTPFASIKGGAGILSTNYILRGQDTLYLQKFDVDASDGTLYTHQYMQNIMAPYTESQMVKTAYSKVNALDNPFVFKIPVYENMPAGACPVPSQTTTVKPTATPTVKPAATPTVKPAATPTVKPAATPTVKPTATPTVKPTATPTVKPTAAPTSKPVATPTVASTANPTAAPTAMPTAKPAAAATAQPTTAATTNPAATVTATAKPTATPTVKPAVTETAKPTAMSTVKPTAASTAQPTTEPVNRPTADPKTTPTSRPTADSTVMPTSKPTAKPADKPTAAPTVEPAAKTTTESVNAPAGTSTENPAIETAAAPAMPAAENPSSPVSTQENTSSSGLTVAAATPRPQTASENQDTLTMNIGETGMVYAETLKKIKDQGAEVVLEVNDKVSWTIDGSTIESDTLEDINLGVKLGTGRIPKNMLDLLAGNESYIEISLAHEGALCFGAQLSVKLEQALPGQYANLFYYNEGENAFEFMCASVVRSTGRATFEFKHASDYVIIISDDTKENLLAEKSEELIKAKELIETKEYTNEEVPAKEPGKAAGIIALILLGSAAIGIGIYLFTKK